MDVESGDEGDDEPSVVLRVVLHGNGCLLRQQLRDEDLPAVGCRCR